MQDDASASLNIKGKEHGGGVLDRAKGCFVASLLAMTVEVIKYSIN